MADNELSGIMRTYTNPFRRERAPREFGLSGYSRDLTVAKDRGFGYNRAYEKGHAPFSVPTDSVYLGSAADSGRPDFIFVLL